MKKINGKVIFIIVIWLLIISLLIYSRFTNLGWGLPYPMHPDERNMANAIQSLNCNIKNQISNIKDCFNPHFFAYGQFPLYLGYVIVFLLKFFDGDLGRPIGFQEAVISLRVISAVASILNAIIIINIIKVIIGKARFSNLLLAFIIITFSPFFIQFSHFGTTESLLMLFYSLIVFYSIRLLERRTTYAVVWLALVSGLAVATKVSSIIFLAVPVIVLMLKIKDKRSNLSSKLKVLNFTLGFALCTLIFALVFSPHNFINFQDFVSEIRYESDVALGRVLVFYTRQFFNTAPVWFQLTKVFPYVLGWPVFILGSLGILGGLGWKDKKVNLLRFAILVYFIPSAFLYAKWIRFMAPIFPIMTVFAVLFLMKVRVINVIKIIIIILVILPGITYLSIYQNPDVRFQASEWIYKNIPENSYILSETANVVDIPLEVPSYKVHKVYKVISFNFYDLDESPELQSELKDHLEKANYIFIPSRRIFANHYCEENDKLQITNDKSITNNKCQMLKKKYPLLNDYYNKLFSGKLGFTKVAEFKSLPDEGAEETWSVFDHPVIRIYKKIKTF